MAAISDSVSIIVPGFNEERRILSTLETLMSFCDRNFQRYEIIFVDDGSTDRTWDLVKEFSSPSRIRTIHLNQNRGKGYAVKQGMLKAKGGYRFFTDADLPYDLSCFHSAMDRFYAKKCDMVIGARDLSQSRDLAGLSPVRRIAGRTFSALVNGFMKIDVRDSQCGFKGFTEYTAQKIFSKTTINGYAFDVEILLLAKRLNLHIQKIPVTLVRKHHSKIHLIRDAFFMLADVSRLFLRQGRAP